MFRLKFQIAVIAGLVLSGCATSKIDLDNEARTALSDEFAPVSLEAVALENARDVFKIGDIADVTVYNVEELSQRYLVGRSGTIAFPLIGKIDVAGLTTVGLENILTERYGASYLKAPSVNVNIEQSDLGRIVVDGAVVEAGVFDLKDIITLSEALALAKGIDGEVSSGSNIYVVRNFQGERAISQFDIGEIRALKKPDPQIIPNDVIFVEDTSGRVLFSEFLRTAPIFSTVAILATRR